jgi:hypothetical protein
VPAGEKGDSAASPSLRDPALEVVSRDEVTSSLRFQSPIAMVRGNGSSPM